jgi:hypothetical protein
MLKKYRGIVCPLGAQLPVIAAVPLPLEQTLSAELEVPVPVALEYPTMPSRWTPSIVPNGDDQNVYLVVDDFGRNGRVYREADVDEIDLETVVADLLSGQYKNPVRIVAFNTAEKWSQDVSADVAHELRHRCDEQMRDIPFGLQDFVDRYEGRYYDVQLPLPLRLV